MLRSDKGAPDLLRMCRRCVLDPNAAGKSACDICLARAHRRTELYLRLAMVLMSILNAASLASFSRYVWG